MNELQWKIDRDDARFLAAVDHCGGTAPMHRIRARTGLTRGKANHRFEKLEDIGLIDITYQQYRSGNEKVAHLTGKARTEIERGLLSDLDDNLTNSEIQDLKAEVRDLRTDMDRIESKLDVLSDMVSNNEDDIDWLQSYIIDWTDEAESQILAVRDALEEEFDLDPMDYQG